MTIAIRQSVQPVFWHIFWQLLQQARREARRQARWQARWQAALLLVIVGSVVLTVQAQPVTAELYAERLARFDQQLLELAESRLSAAELNSALREAREAIPVTVEIASKGTRRQVDNGWILREMEVITRLAEAGDRDWRPHLIDLEYRIGRLRRLLPPAGSSGRPLTERSERERLTGILSRPEYQRAGEPAAAGRSALQQWWSELKSTLRDLFRRLLPSPPQISTGEAESPQTISKLISLLLLATLAILGSWQVRRLWKKLVRGGPNLAEPAAGGSVAEPFDDGLDEGVWNETPDELLNRAARRAGAAEYREAIRLAYLACLIDLARRQLFEISPAWTNRDYLDAVRNHPGIFSPLLKITLLFEDFWYGQRSPLATDYETTLKLAKLIVTEET